MLRWTFFLLFATVQFWLSIATQIKCNNHSFKSNKPPFPPVFFNYSWRLFLYFTFISALLLSLVGSRFGWFMLWLNWLAVWLAKLIGLGRYKKWRSCGTSVYLRSNEICFTHRKSVLKGVLLTVQSGKFSIVTVDLSNRLSYMVSFTFTGIESSQLQLHVVKYWSELQSV